MTGPGPGDGDGDWGFNSPPDANLGLKTSVFPLGTRNVGKRAGERRAPDQQCPLQASLGGARQRKAAQDRWGFQEMPG